MTLISAISSYLITEIPLEPSQTLLVNPLPLQWTFIFIIIAVLQFTLGYVSIATASAVYNPKAGQVTVNMMLPLEGAFIGVTLAYYADVLPPAVSSRNTFAYYLSGVNSTLVPLWGFILILSGALISSWALRKGTS